MQLDQLEATAARFLNQSATAKRYNGRAPTAPISYKSKKKMVYPSQPLETLICQISDAGLPSPLHNYQFADFRLWRCALAWPERKLLVEVMESEEDQGRTSGMEFKQEIEKYNTAVILGFHPFYLLPQHVYNGLALSWISRFFENNPVDGIVPKNSELQLNEKM